MVFDWERAARLFGKFFLLLLEYCIKLAAIVVTAVVLIADGSFGTKLGAGFSSLSISLRNVFEAPSEIIRQASVVHDYQTLPADAFEIEHGSRALHEALAYFDGAVLYFQDVSANFTGQPFATLSAALIAFFSLYSISLILRFTRQKGQGSPLNRLERKLAEKVFKNPKDLYKPKRKGPKKPEAIPQQRVPRSKPSAKPSAKSGVKRDAETKRKKKKSAFGNASKTNKHLQDYLNQAKS